MDTDNTPVPSEPVIQPQKNPKPPTPKFPFLKKRLFLIISALLILSIISAFGVNSYFLSQNSKNDPAAKKLDPIIPPKTLTPSSSPTPSPINLTPTGIPKNPTVTNKTTSAPAPSNTSVPATATSEPKMGPPVMNISYPTENQSITMNSDQTFCVVDTPVSNTGPTLEKKQNLNDQGWTTYASPYTTCFSPLEGANTIQFQYKNKDAESQIYTIHFTFHRE